MEKEVAKLKEAIADLAPKTADAVAVEEDPTQVETVAEATETAPAEDLSAEEPAGSHDEIIELMRGLADKVETLNAKIDELTAENTALKESLATKDAETAEFIGQLKNIKLSLSEAPKKTEPAIRSNIVSNPIGE